MIRVALAGLALTMLPAPHAQAQELDTSIRPEIRADAIVSRGRTTVQGGVGVQIPAGVYARIGVDAALGADVANGTSALSGRLDIAARFLFDPFRQTRWGFSPGGGISLRATERAGVRPYLLALFDLEAPRTGNGLSPAVQVGVGGGVRVGVVLRWSSSTVR